EAVLSERSVEVAGRPVSGDNDRAGAVERRVEEARGEDLPVRQHEDRVVLVAAEGLRPAVVRRHYGAPGPAARRQLAPRRGAREGEARRVQDGGIRPREPSDHDLAVGLARDRVGLDAAGRTEVGRDEAAPAEGLVDFAVRADAGEREGAVDVA